MTQRVVVGDDGSESAGQAWRWVDAQDWDGWAVDVVTAHADPAALPTTAELATPHPWQPAHPRVPAAPARIGGGVRHLRALGDPRAVLLGFPDAALMVIGRRGRGRLAALKLGSTADWLLHGPPCPLLLAADDRPVGRVVVCVDGSKHAQSAARAFARLPWAGAGGVRVEVLSVPDRHTDPGPATAAVLDLLAGLGVTAHAGAVGPGRADPRDVIVKRVAADAVDLLVMGTQGVGIGTARRLLRGSVAAYVAHHAPCSVLVADHHEALRT